MPRPQAKSTKLIDDERVRVTRWDFEPDAETGRHPHEMDYLVVPVTDCAFLLEEPAGERRVDIVAGATYRRNEGVEHNVVNGGVGPMSFVEVELKH
jgi:beta-alanine degradation protein BauB